MSYKNTRDKEEYTPKEKVIVATFEEKGWRFRWDDNWDYHNRFSRGNSIEFKSPLMSEYVTYHAKELNAEQLLHQEREFVISNLAERRAQNLHFLFEEKVREYLVNNPTITLDELNKVSTRKILYGV